MINETYSNEIVREVYPLLSQHSSILFTFIQDMIEPVFGDEIDTACVYFDPNKPEKNIRFVFNKSFWDKLNSTEKVFLFIHETMHILFRHGIKGKEFFETLDKQDRNDKILNMAMDITINEIILEQYFNGVSHNIFPVMKTGCFVKTCFPSRNDILKNQGFEYYYKELMKDPNNLVGNSFDIMSNESLEELDEIVKKVLEEQSEKNSDNYNINENVSDNTEKTVVTTSTRKEQLDNYLNDMISSKFGGKEPKPKMKRVWYKSPRRMSLGKDVILPKVEEIPLKKGKYKIVVYCDVSGSVSRISNEFFELISNLNKEKFEIDLYAFADNVVGVKTDKKGSYKYIGAGGGTNINKVLYHYENNFKKKDDINVVLVLTDGAYSYISHLSNDVYNSWYFFMTGSSKNAPKKSNIINMKNIK